MFKRISQMFENKKIRKAEKDAKADYESSPAAYDAKRMNQEEADVEELEKQRKKLQEKYK